MLPEQIKQKLLPVYNEALEDFQQRLNKITLERATPALLEDVEVNLESYNARVKELAAIRTLDSSTLLIEPWDKKTIDAIQQAVASAKAHFSVSNQGGGIYVKLPPATSEVKERFVKEVSGIKEEARIKVRQIREEAWQEIQERFRRKELTEDEKFRAKVALDEQIHEINGKIEEMAAKRIKQIEGL
jgi:ribosome recycling factor